MTVTIRTTIQGEAYEFTGANAAEVQALVAEMAATLDATLNSLTVVKQIATAKNVLGGPAAPVAGGTPWTAPPAPAAQAAPAPQGPPGSVAPNCAVHNAPMVWRSGISKNKNPYALHSCQIKDCDQKVWAD